jgi:hypothetical protein
MFILSTRSGLGPNKIRYASCQTVFESGLLEWTQMSFSQKIRYAFLSIIYALFLGWMFTMPTMEIIGLIYFPTDRNFPSSDFMRTSVSIYAFFVICLQIIRVALSYIRVDEGVGEQPMEISFWTWQTNPQGCGMTLGVLAIAIYFIVAIGLR